jgi:Ran GTPase-activating protein (RanGAP) involved in mRNA processing and transport
MSFGIFSREGSRKELKLNGYCMGDQYAEVVSRAVKRLPDLQLIDVKANHLTDRGMLKVVKSVAYDNVKELDLSQNSIGFDTIFKLSTKLVKPDCSLETLKLESCGIKGLMLKKLVEVVIECRTLKHLSLAKNHIGRIDTKAIGDLLNYNRSLVKIDLHYNALAPCGLLQGLADNEHVVEIDLSWNALGKSPEVVELLSRVFENNQVLRHLDISFTSLTRSQCEVLGVSLQANRTLYGVHVEGNPFLIDAMGYLKYHGAAWLQDRGHITDRLFQHRRIQMKKSRHCWICEGWTEFVFEYDPALIGWTRQLKQAAYDRLATYDEPVFIHIDVDDWLPSLMTRTPSGVYQLRRAMPQRAVCFFFAYRGTVQISSQYSVQAPSHPINRAFKYYLDFAKHHRVVAVNQVVVEGSPCTVQHLLGLSPRPPLTTYSPPADDLPQMLELDNWTFESSVFARYRLDSEDLFSKCMESDWINSRVSQLISNPEVLHKLKGVLTQNYRVM